MRSSQVEKAKETLEFYNEKAEKLQGLSFTSSILNQNSGVHLSWTRDSGILKIDREGPDEESIDAFVLTLRFFMQDNEPTSLRNMAKLIEALPINEQNKENFRITRKTINEFLDSNTFITLNDKKLTHREIMDVFIYGGLAHGTHRDVFIQWRKIDVLFPVLLNEFVLTITEFLNAIFCIRNNNLEIIKQL